jgi:tetratricopeptide (TPR) repeat protein
MWSLSRELRAYTAGVAHVAGHAVDRAGFGMRVTLALEQSAQGSARRDEPFGFVTGAQRKEKRTGHRRLYASRLDNRTDILKQMLAADPANSFARYGLAMEMIKGGDLAGAVNEFQALVERDPNYSAGYFHGGQTLEKLGRLDEARDFYRRGLAVTRDPHARGELQAALDILGE